MTDATLVKSLSDIERDSDVKTLTDQAGEIASRASILAIYSPETMKEVGELRLEAQRIAKQLEGRRKFFVDPHNQFVKMINGWFKIPTDLISGTIDKLGARMVKYSDEMEAVAKEAERKILADQRTKAETKSEKLAAIPEAPKTVRSETGTTGFRIDKVLEIYDAQQIPRLYLVPDEVTIKQALKDGVQIAGARLIDKKVATGRSY